MKDAKIRIYAPPERKVGSEQALPLPRSTLSASVVPRLSGSSSRSLTVPTSGSVLDLDRWLHPGQPRNVQEGETLAD